MLALWKSGLGNSPPLVCDPSPAFMKKTPSPQWERSITSIIHIFIEKEINVTKTPGWMVSPSDPHPTCISEEIQDLGATMYFSQFPLTPRATTLTSSYLLINTFKRDDKKGLLLAQSHPQARKAQKVEDNFPVSSTVSIMDTNTHICAYIHIRSLQQGRCH